MIWFWQKATRIAMRCNNHLPRFFYHIAHIEGFHIGSHSLFGNSYVTLCENLLCGLCGKKNNRNLMTGRQLAEKIYAEYGTTDVFQLAEKAGCTVVYARWQPVTLGEYHRKTKTIFLNENGVGERLENVLVHELGHFFCDAFLGNVPQKEAEDIAIAFAAAWASLMSQ
jgi:IrrE N-terminal-like domain